MSHPLIHMSQNFGSHPWDLRFSRSLLGLLATVLIVAALLESEDHS